jgi:hypothetical protein
VRKLLANCPVLTRSIDLNSGVLSKLFMIFCGVVKIN